MTTETKRPHRVARDGPAVSKGAHPLTVTLRWIFFAGDTTNIAWEGRRGIKFVSDDAITVTRFRVLGQSVWAGNIKFYQVEAVYPEHDLRFLGRKDIVLLRQMLREKIQAALPESDVRLIAEDRLVLRGANLDAGGGFVKDD